MPFSSGQRLRILIAGGSGQIGRYLAAHFQAAGHLVVVLTRLPYTANWTTVYWDGVHAEAHRENNWLNALAQADVLINLAGSSIACPLTRKNRQSIRDSRILSTRLLGRALAAIETPPRLWLNASSAILDTLPPGKPASGTANFFTQLAEDWEAEFFSAPTPATRKIALRSGLFLAAEPGNLFATLSLLVRAGLGGTLGSGHQFVPWIHAADYARAIGFLIERDDLEGPFTLSAPEPLPNRDFMAVLRDAWDRPNGLPWPTPLLWLAGLARTDLRLALHSCPALPSRLTRAGFAFEFPDWPSAALDLARQWRELEL
jgi:uncharacterized protein (TIGR01777 family)